MGFLRILGEYEIVSGPRVVSMHSNIEAPLKNSVESRLCFMGVGFPGLICQLHTEEGI